MSNGLWHRTLVYLGLTEESEEAHGDLPERSGDGGQRWEDETAGGHHDRFDPAGDPELDPDRPRGGRSRWGDPAAVTGESNVRPLRAADADHTRSSPPRLSVVEIVEFDDVERVGSRYRADRPVLFDVKGADGATARRVVDFVAGLTYALHGRMHKVGTRAFLLVPDGVELPDDDARRLTTLGYRLPTGSDS